MIRSSWTRAALVAVAVVVLDQLAKHAVRASIVQGEERGVLPGLALVNTRNRGVAFGFLPGDQVAVTIVIALALLALLVYFALHTGRPLIWLPTGMLLGGALGNVIDRLRAGYVTDFVKLPLGWPPFNFADVSITLGVLILVLLIERPREGDRPSSIHQPAIRVGLAPDPTGSALHAPSPALFMTPRSPTTPPSFSIAYQDDHLLVVDKPAGLVVHPARGHREGTLSQLLAGVAAGGDPERAGIVHRLDRDTSGLLVVARSEEVHRLLQQALAARWIEREYLALVEGRPGARSGTIEAPIGRDPTVRTRMAVGGNFPARPALTSRSIARSPRTRCCACGSTRAALTRSACTCRRSAIPSPATPSTEPPGHLVWSASSCTPPASRCPTR